MTPRQLHALSKRHEARIRREDAWHGQIAYMIAAVNTPRNKPRPKPRDFLFFAPPAKPQTWRQQLAVAKQITALMGGQIKSGPSTSSG